MGRDWEEQKDMQLGMVMLLEEVEAAERRRDPDNSAAQPR
jgi:hypothetical protein